MGWFGKLSRAGRHGNRTSRRVFAAQPCGAPDRRIVHSPEVCPSATTTTESGETWMELRHPIPALRGAGQGLNPRTSSSSPTPNAMPKHQERARRAACATPLAGQGTIGAPSSSHVHVRFRAVRWLGVVEKITRMFERGVERSLPSFFAFPVARACMRALSLSRWATVSRSAVCRRNQPSSASASPHHGGCGRPLRALGDTTSPSRAPVASLTARDRNTILKAACCSRPLVSVEHGMLD